jgi:filamentous hemagglutinin family protein
MRVVSYIFASMTGLLGFLSTGFAAPPTSITLDGSLGHGAGAVLPTSPGFYAITPAMGKSVGSNLFQSFGVFNLGTGDTADFEANAGTQNIIARVTGGSASSIDGTIESAANLWFINPAGIMFTANASLNVNGAFVASTANYVKLGDGTVFYADVTHPISDAGLTSAPVSAFGFTTAAPAPISFVGSTLAVGSGQGLHFIGGDETLDGAVLSAPAGFLTMFSAASAGELPFNLASPASGFATAPFSAFGNITLKNQSSASINGNGGGHMVIRGGKLRVDNSQMSSVNSGSGTGGDISLHADNFTMLDGAEIYASSRASGNAGNVSVTANSMTLDGTGAGGASPSQTGIGSETDAGATGNAGVMSVTVTGALSLTNGGTISASTYSSGNGGNVIVNAGSIAINSLGSPTLFTGITSGAEPGATGNAGEVNVTSAGSISIVGQTASIDSTTFGSGNAGPVTVNAVSLSIDDSAEPNATLLGGISSDSVSNDPTTTGNAGLVTVNVSGALVMTGGCEIASDTDTAGNAGNIVVNAASLTIDGSAAPNNFTGIRSTSFDTATGNGGNITIDVSGAMILRGEGEVASNTFSSGNGGIITVHAGSLLLDDSARPGDTGITGILSLSTPGGITSGGSAGSISINVNDSLVLLGSGQITTDTLTAGPAGNIAITAGSLTIDGSATPDKFTGVSSSSHATATGNSGDVTVDVSGLIKLIGEGRIISSTFSSANAGKITVHAGAMTLDDTAGPNDPLATGILSDSDSSDPTSPGKAGAITVDVTGALVMTNGGEITTDTVTAGNAGNVVLQAGSLTINGGVSQNFTGISSESAGVDSSLASSGNVTVDVRGAHRLIDGGDIESDTETSGNAGDVAVHAGSLAMDDTGGDFFTGISSDALNDNDINATNNTGNAGRVSVVVDGRLAITGGAEIDATTETAGQGGSITVQAGALAIDGATAPGFETGVTAEADAAGNGGSITVDAGSINLVDSGLISASSFNSNAGNIVINAGNLSLVDTASIDTSAANDGGSINLNISNMVYLFNSVIKSAAFGGAVTSGGNIRIENPRFVILDDSLISANDLDGAGGNITIVAQDFLDESSILTATGATNNGTISISAPDLDLVGGLLPLPNALVNDENRLRENCARSIKHEFSSLIAVGRGGTEQSPDELQADFGIPDASSPVTP